MTPYRTGRKTPLLLICIWTIFPYCKKSITPPAPPETRAKVIVVLGSSTAAGTGATPLDSSWVNKLSYQLTKDDRNTQVVNLAMAGFTTYKVLPSTYSSADTARNVNKALSLKPNLIIINLPDNDFADGYSDDEIINNYATITGTITGAHVAFILISTQPRNFSSLDERKRLQLFNPKLSAIYPNTIVNVYDQLATPDYYINPQYSFGDGIHLNNQGHTIIFKSVLVFPVLNAVCY